MAGWQAGMQERRIALGVAAAALLLIALALIAPDWFPSDSTPRQAPEAEAPKPRADTTPSFHVPPAPPERVKPEAGQAPPAPAVRPAPGTAVRPLPDSPPTTRAASNRLKPAAPAATPPDRRRDARKPVKQAVARGEWFVQVGAFKSRARARAMLRRIRDKGFDGRIVPKAGGLHAVQAGPRESREAARTLQQSLRIKAGIKGFIVRIRNPG
ncbi:MAG: SPOR domain-containing protein [Mariprofundaceae bacterium]